MSKAKREREAPSPPAATPVSKATPVQDCGIPDDQIERCRKWFGEMVKLLKKDEQSQERLIAAVGLWIGYPQLLERIGHNVKIVGPMPVCCTLDHPESSWAAYGALNHAHHLATHFLMAQAEKCGLDPHPLFECGNLIKDLYAREPWRYYAGRVDTWPECMGTERYSLPAGVQEALRAGEAVFVRLAVKLGMAKKEDVAEVAAKVRPSLPLPGEQRTAPMTLEELCHRYMDKRKARADKFRSVLEQYGLRREHHRKNLWTVRLDLMDKATRERMTRENQP